MEFLFDDSHITLYDERISAFFDVDDNVKAIAKRDMLLSSEGTLSCSIKEELNATYTFVEKWIPLDNIQVSILLNIEALGSFDVLTLKHGGYVRIVPGAFQVHLVSEEGEFTVDLSGVWDFSGHVMIKVKRSGDKMFFDANGMGIEIELPENCRKNLEIAGLFGQITGSSIKVFSIQIEEDEHEERIELTPMKFSAHVTENTINEMNKYHSPEKEKRFYKSLNVEEEISALLREEENLRRKAMSKNKTPSETSILTGFSDEQMRTMSRYDLLRSIYNGLSRKHPERDHISLLKDTHYQHARFLDGDATLEVPTMTVEAKYSTFEFGDITPDNCTPEKLLYLAKTYPEVWLDRIKMKMSPNS